MTLTVSKVWVAPTVCLNPINVDALNAINSIVWAPTAYDVEATTTSGSYIDTGLTATITPKFASSKILVHISQNGVGTTASNGGVYGQLVRGSTVLGWLGRNVAYTGDTSQVRIGTGWSCSWLDSPSTTSATTYKTQWKSFNGESALIQQSEAHSTITLMEVSV